MVLALPYVVAASLVHDATGWSLGVSIGVGSVAWLILWGAVKGIGRWLVQSSEVLVDRLDERRDRREAQQARLAESEAIVEEWRRRRRET